MTVNRSDLVSGMTFGELVDALVADRQFKNLVNGEANGLLQAEYPDLVTSAANAAANQLAQQGGNATTIARRKPKRWEWLVAGIVGVLVFIAMASITVYGDVPVYIHVIGLVLAVYLGFIFGRGTIGALIKLDVKGPAQRVKDRVEKFSLKREGKKAHEEELIELARKRRQSQQSP